MAYKEVLRVQIAEVVRRWQAGNSQRSIASGTGLSRDTVRKYLAAAEETGVVREGPAPTEEQLTLLVAISRSGPGQAETPSEDLLAPWSDQVYRWLKRRSPAVDPHSGVAGPAWLPGVLLVAAPVRGSPQVAGTEPDYGSNGLQRTG